MGDSAHESPSNVGQLSRFPDRPPRSDRGTRRLGIGLFFGQACQIENLNDTENLLSSKNL